MQVVELWRLGKRIGRGKFVTIDTARVLLEDEAVIRQMKADAAKEGVTLTVVVGVRTFDEQLAIRKRFVEDKTKENDRQFLLNAPVSEFSPMAARPGWSNHGHGNAFDFAVTHNKKAYKWLIDNAHKYGMIRTVPSERWHWEQHPGEDRFSRVPRNHKTWDNLV